MRDLNSYLRLIQDDLDLLRLADADILSANSWKDVQSLLADILSYIDNVKFILEI